MRTPATQQAIGRDAGPTGVGGLGVAGGQALTDEVDECVVLQELVDGVEQIVFEQGGLLGQGEEEEPGLVLGGGDHDVLDYIE